MNFLTFLVVVFILVFFEADAVANGSSCIFLVVLFHAYAETNGKIRLLLLARALSERESKREPGSS